MIVDYPLAFQLELVRLLKEHFARHPVRCEARIGSEGDEAGEVTLTLNVADHYWTIGLEGYVKKVFLHHSYRKGEFRTGDTETFELSTDAPEQTAAAVYERLIAQLPSDSPSEAQP